MNAANENGFTALMIAAQNGHTATVLALVQECGADVNAAQQDGCTTLMSAAQNGHTATVVALAQECGVDVNAVNKIGFTALMSAAQNGHTGGAGAGMQGRRECWQAEWLDNPHERGRRWASEHCLAPGDGAQGRCRCLKLCRRLVSLCDGRVISGCSLISDGSRRPGA